MQNQDLHATALPTDLVIVCYDEYLGQAQRLAERRASEGLSVRIVTPQQVFNELSSGARDASAIKRYMRMLYDRASVPEEIPRYRGGLCTGTLVTPSLLPTANHCVYGWDDCNRPGGPPFGVRIGDAIEVGPVQGSPHSLQPDVATPWLGSSRIVQFRSMIGGPTDCENDDLDSDLALVDLYPPVVNGGVSGLPVAYPRFPTLAPIVPYATQTVRIAGWVRTAAGALATVRQVNGPQFPAPDADGDGFPDGPLSDGDGVPDYWTSFTNLK